MITNKSLGSNFMFDKYSVMRLPLWNTATTTDIMPGHGSHNVRQEVIQVSVRPENSRAFLRRFYWSSCAQSCWIAQQWEVDWVLDCGELHDVQIPAVVVSSVQPPFQHSDDRILKELDPELLVHQTVGGEMVTVRYMNPSQLTFTGRNHGHNLQIIISYNHSLSLMNL